MKKSLNFLPSHSFGKNLREIRKLLGMSASELANRAGVTAAAISQIENGTRDPSLSTIIAILGVLPVKFERLIGK
jgi:transcriptional regulator with XRE-family HTH domain